MREAELRALISEAINIMFKKGKKAAIDEIVRIFDSSLPN